MGNSEKSKTRMQIFVRKFQDATNWCMTDYIKCSIRAKPNHFILDIGTNDLNSNEPPDKIAKPITDLIWNLKNLMSVSRQL